MFFSNDFCAGIAGKIHAVSVICVYIPKERNHYSS